MSRETDDALRAIDAIVLLARTADSPERDEARRATAAVLVVLIEGVVLGAIERHSRGSE